MRLQNRGWLRLYLLKIDPDVAAALFGFRYEDTFYYLQSGYYLQWSRYSQGSLLVGLVFQAAIDEGYQQFDFLRGAEPYKYEWGGIDHKTLSVKIQQPGQQCQLYRLLNRMNAAISRLCRLRFLVQN